jgi:hypothetical protein
MPAPAPACEPTPEALAGLPPAARAFVDAILARFDVTALDLEVLIEAAWIRQRLTTIRASGATVRDEVALSRQFASLLEQLEVER